VRIQISGVERKGLDRWETRQQRRYVRKKGENMREKSERRRFLEHRGESIFIDYSLHISVGRGGNLSEIPG
jgi:hypothetical protein